MMPMGMQAVMVHDFGSERPSDALLLLVFSGME